MTRIGPQCIALVGFVLTLSFGGPAQSDARIWLVGEPSPGMPACEEFYDKWDVPGAPPGLLAMAGLGREVVAARDCVAKNNIPLACKHWQGLLVVLDKLGPPLNESRGDIEELMRQHDCEAVPDSETKSPPESDSAPPSEASPESQSTPAPEASHEPEAAPGSESVPASEASPDAAE